MASALQSITLRRLAVATVAVLGAGYALAFFYAPEDADQGFIQKIFYLHVPLATVSLLGFMVAAVHAIRHLRTGDPRHDARSYVSIHISVIFGLAVLLTGAIWAKGSWGVWWEWKEPTLVSFLIVFLLYATYYPLRYAIEDRDRQARYASVFAITAGAFVPLNFLAVRLAQPLHPPADLLLGRRPARRDAVRLPGLPGGDGAAVGDAGLVRARVEGRLGEPRADPPRAGAPRRAAAPWIRRWCLCPPLAVGRMTLLAIESADRYVGGAYLVFLLLLLVYVAIMAAKLQRIQRELGSLAELAERRRARAGDARCRADPRPRGRDRGRPPGRSRMSGLLALGVSHRTAPLALREQLALTEGRAAGVLNALVSEEPISEAAALSTCNRTELYLVATDSVEAEAAGLGVLAREAGIRPTELLGPLYSLRGAEAAPAPLPGDRGARLDDRRRGGDPGSGEAGLRAGAGGGGHRPDPQPHVPRGARRRQAGAHRDRGRREGRLDSLGRGRAGPAQPRRPRAPGACC